MAVPAKQIKTTVGFQDPAGNVSSQGTLVLTLSQNAEVAASGGQVYPKPLAFTLTSGGLITQSAIWFNDELTPSGTTYNAKLYSQGGSLLQDFGAWSFTGAGPLDLSTMTPSSSTVSYSASVLLAPTAQQKITGFPLELAKTLVLDGSTSGTTTVQASATASGTLTLPATTDTLVGKATTDTLTNKTLTAPSISSAAFSNTVPTYNGRATASNGLAATFGADDKTAQSANIGTVTLLTGTASTSGHYRINGLIACTATDASGATVTLTTNWTQDGIARSSTTSSIGVNATTNVQNINGPIFIDSSTNVTYSTTVTGTPTTGRYSVHIWLTQE